MVQYSRLSRGRSGFDSLVGNSFDRATQRSVRKTQRRLLAKGDHPTAVVSRLLVEVELRLSLVPRAPIISRRQRSLPGYAVILLLWYVDNSSCCPHGLHCFQSAPENNTTVPAVLRPICHWTPSTLSRWLLYFNARVRAISSETSLIDPHNNMATQGGPTGRELDQQVLQCLEATLSPEQGRRRDAEEQLKTLYHHPGRS